MFATLLKTRKAVPLDHAAAILAEAEKKHAQALAHFEQCHQHG
jgi:hypothetical protein